MRGETRLVVRLAVVVLGLSFFWGACAPELPVSEPGSQEKGQSDVEKARVERQLSREQLSTDEAALAEPLPEPVPDAAADPDAAAPQDVRQPPAERPALREASPGPSMTWWECRRNKDALSPSQKATCAKHHSLPPARSRYHIRWVFLYDKSAPEAWIKPRMELLNARFQGAQMSFKTHSITVLKGSALTVGGTYDNRKSYRVSQLSAELKQLLGLPPATSAAAALKAWKDQLTKVGVLASQVQALTATTALRPNAFLNRVARALEREIFVFVAARLITNTGATPGGYASLPSLQHQAINRGSIFLKEQYRPDALAHEMGHYFGLTHTQAAAELLSPQSAITQACRALLPQGLSSIKAALQKHLGADFRKPLGQPFVAYDAPDPLLTEFRTLRCALGQLWIKAVNCFQKTSDDPKTWKNFPSFPSFLEHLFQGGKAYEKLFSEVVNGKSRFNCGLQSNPRRIACTYGGHKILGDQPLLMGSIAFQKGEVSNLMSYLNNATAFPVRLLNSAQHQMLQLHSRAADRLALQNLELVP